MSNKRLDISRLATFLLLLFDIFPCNNAQVFNVHHHHYIRNAKKRKKKHTVCLFCSDAFRLFINFVFVQKYSKKNIQHSSDRARIKLNIKKQQQQQREEEINILM